MQIVVLCKWYSTVLYFHGVDIGVFVSAMADGICLVCLAPVVETYKRECCDYLIDIIWMHAIASLFLRLTILKSNTSP